MIVENFLDKEVAKNILATINRKDFKWRYKSKNHASAPENLSVFQFVHSLTSQVNNNRSEFCDDILNPVLDAFEASTGLKVKRVIRAKVNLLTRMDISEIELAMMEHQDLYGEDVVNKYSIVFYIEDSDGDTVIFDNKHQIIEVASPKENSAVIFRSELVHRGTPPKVHKRRVILNVILEIEQNG